jgi:hypothetical protein
MPKRGPTVIWASVLAGVFAIGAIDSASAASNCLSRPGAYAGPGTHWFYRIDRATQRRCWYVKQVGPTASRTRATERVAAADTAYADTQSTSELSFFSWLSSKVSGVTQPSATEAEQAPATRSAPARRTEAPPRRVRVASRSERATSRAERARAPAAARSAQHSPPPRAARAEAPAPALDEAASEALYREFLQWRVKQLFAPESR